MKRRGQDRTIDSDPATQGALGVPKVLESTGDPGGMHREDDLDRMLDRDSMSDDAEVTARPHERRRHERPADPQSPEELAADALALATQGGGSFLDEDEEDNIEDEIDREAIASGIVPQMVGQATLESASSNDDQVLEPGEEADEDAPTLPRDRSRPGRTGVDRVRRSDAR